DRWIFRWWWAQLLSWVQDLRPGLRPGYARVGRRYPQSSTAGKRKIMKLYNTLTKQVEIFRPREDNKVQMFVCGATVYDFSHLGHAKTYVQLDLLARVLRASNYEVFYLQNITDIDDKIIDRAREQAIDWQDLRSHYQKEYEHDMRELNNSSLNQYARATDYIDNIIQQVQ